MSPVDLSSVMIDGRPVTKLYPGWKALSHFNVTPELDVIHLKELENGKDALWWLDKDGRYLASHATVLPQDQKDRLIAYMEPVLAPLQMNMQCPVPVALPAEAEKIRVSFIRLPYPVVLEVMSLWCQKKLSQTMIFSPDAIIGASIKLDGDHIVTFSQESLHQVLKTPLTQEKAIYARSPFSDRFITAQIESQSIEGPFARFFDADSQVIFYIFWQPSPSNKNLEQDSKKIVFYYPRGCLLIGDYAASELIPLWLMLFFMLYNDKLSELKLEPLPLNAPQPEELSASEQAETSEPQTKPQTICLPDFNSDPKALIPVNDLNYGKISSIWDIMTNGDLPPMEFPFSDTRNFPFSPFAKSRT